MENEKELEILRSTVNHYAEYGYSKAIKALKEIENLSAEEKSPEQNEQNDNSLKKVIFALIALSTLVVYCILRYG